MPTTTEPLPILFPRETDPDQIDAGWCVDRNYVIRIQQAARDIAKAQFPGAVVELAVQIERVEDVLLAVERLYDPALSFSHGTDAHHVLRILGNGQISAGKAAELLLAIQRGESPQMPPFEVGVEIPAPAAEPRTVTNLTEIRPPQAVEFPLPGMQLADDFGDPETLLNSRDWLRKACEAKGGRFTGGSIGCGEADIDIELEGCRFNVSIRPLPPTTT